MKQRLINLPVKEIVHSQIVQEARVRGMTIQGLTERIMVSWLNRTTKKNLLVESLKDTKDKKRDE